MKIKSLLCGLVCLCLLSGCSGKPEQIPTSEHGTTTTVSEQAETTTTEVPTTTATEAEQTETPTTEKTETPTQAPTKAPTQPPTKAPEKRTGTVKGCITYQYNKTIGTKGDVGAYVLLIPNSLPNEVITYENFLTHVGLPAHVGLPEGVFDTKADGYGNYIFQDIPEGKYELVIKSNNTRCKGNDIATTMGFLHYYNEEAQERILAGYENYKSKFITISAGKEIVFSHDFGYTYF